MIMLEFPLFPLQLFYFDRIIYYLTWKIKSFDPILPYNIISKEHEAEKITSVLLFSISFSGN